MTMSMTMENPSSCRSRPPEAPNVTRGLVDQATVMIVDDDVPDVTVSFASDSLQRAAKSTIPRRVIAMTARPR